MWCSTQWGGEGHISDVCPPAGAIFESPDVLLPVRRLTTMRDAGVPHKRL